MSRKRTGPITQIAVITVLILAFVSALVFFSGCASTGSKVLTEEQIARDKAVQDSIKQAQRLEKLKSWSLAYENYKNKVYRESVKPFWRVIEMDEGVDELKEKFTFLGDCYLKLNVPDSALIVYEMGVEVFPDNPYLHRSLGYLYTAMERVDEAIEQYEIFVEMKPESVDDLRLLANLYIKNDQPEDAVSSLEKVIELDPNDKASQETLGQLYRSLGEEGNYVQALENAHNLDPENTSTMMQLGKAYYDGNENEKAVEMYQKLLVKTPDDVLAMEYLAGAYQNLHQYNDALAVYDNILKLQPDHKKVICEKAICYRENGNYRTARNTIRQALKIDGNYGYAYIVAGEVYEASVEKCLDQRGSKVLKFDDKLILWYAYQEYKKAQKDLEFSETARRRMSYLETQIPNQDDIFFHGEQWEKKTSDLDCYRWMF